MKQSRVALGRFRRARRRMGVGALRAWGAVVGTEGVLRLLLRSGPRTATILRAFGAQIGPGTRVLSPLLLHNVDRGFRNLAIGSNCYIGRDVFFDVRNPISVGDSATIAMRVTIVTHFDVGSSPLRTAAYPVEDGAVAIGDGAYIGTGAIVLHGVTIGRCAVVAAGAVVTEDVAPWTLVAGVPARVVRELASSAGDAAGDSA